MIHFILPKPPSLNALYGHNRFGSVYMKKEGKMWIEDAMWRMKTIGSGETITTPVELRVVLYTCRHQDLDNVMKITQDLIAKHAKIIEDDSQIFVLHAEKIKCSRAEEKIDIQIDLLE